MQGCEEEARFKRQRHDVTVQIRREKRQEMFQAARKTTEAEESTAPLLGPETEGYRTKKITIVDPELASEIREIMQESFKEENFPDIVRLLQECHDTLAVHWAAIGLRILMVSPNALEIYYQRVIDSQLVPIIISLTTLQQYPQLKYEAAWILANLASGSNEQARVIVQNGGIQSLVRLVKQKQEKIVEQAIWGVSNLAADDDQYRNRFIESNVMEDIIEAGDYYDSKMLRNICGMALSNLARGKPLPVTVKMIPGLLFLCKGLRNGYFSDPDTIIDALHALYYHFNPKKKNLALLIDSYVIPTILQMGVRAIEKGDDKLTIVITRLLGNIILGSETQVKYLVSEGIYTFMNTLVLNRQELMRKEACWMLSNLAASSSAIAKKLLQQKDLMDKIVQILKNEVSQTVLVEVHYIFFNLSVQVDANTFLAVVHQYEVIGHVADNLLKVSDPNSLFLESILLLLDAYYEIVVGQKNRSRVQLIGSDAKEKIGDLEGHEDEKLVKIAIRIGRHLELLDSDR